jgi:carotenoid cleavage dioxygenase-like enzyme
MAQPLPDNRFLQGPFAPLQMECDASDLIVNGEIPRDLNGSFYRNGPNQHYAPRSDDFHLFSGDGMTHAFHIEDGKVSYRNRWIRTAKFNIESELGRSAINPLNPFDCDEEYMDFALTDKEGLANTACVWHGGKMLIMEEGHYPYEIDPITLESIGSYNFDGKLNTAMTAHPKLDPVTGEMVFFAYMSSGPFEPDVSIYKVNAAGELTEAHLIPTPYSAMVHDFVVTENYIVIPIFPLTGSIERAMQGEAPFMWEPEKGASVGILPRGGGADDIRWVECDDIFVFHFMNGYDKDGVITLDGCQFPHAPLFPRADGKATEDADPRLTRWQIDLNKDNARVVHNPIDEYFSEFPQVDPRYAMKEYRYGFYASQEGEKGEMYNAVCRFDHQTGNSERYSCGDISHNFTSEPIFVPRAADAAEGEGYLLSVITDMSRRESALQILDAQNVSSGPLAVAQLNHRIPIGFHGGWRPAS